MTLPPHITGIQSIRCKCGGSINPEHSRFEQWLEVHKDCGFVKRGPVCLDCRHHKRVMSVMGMGAFYECTRENKLTDMVTGDFVTRYCGDERNSGECGPAAKFFQEKAIA